MSNKSSFLVFFVNNYTLFIKVGLKFIFCRMILLVPSDKLGIAFTCPTFFTSGTGQSDKRYCRGLSQKQLHVTNAAFKINFGVHKPEAQF